MHQTMSGNAAQKQIDAAAQEYAALLSKGAWTLELAHSQLRDANLSLFQIGGLAKAIACFQCSVE